MVEESSAATVKTEPMGKNDKVGSVLVVGGGISGIQSALDLADSGFKVYLVDRSPSIGGAMAQLDKTFPTNDCSMCILAPKLVGTGRHHNIQLITNAEVTGIEGDPGKFKVKVLKHAKSVDADKCTGCGVCTEVCPVRYRIQIKEKPTELEGFEDAKVIDEIIEQNSHFPDPVVQILIDVNEKYKYLPKEALQYISNKMDIPMSHLYRLATFYKAFSLVKKGKYHFKVCVGTACHVRGARDILGILQNEIAGTPEGLFTIETVNCLGACALGPIVVVNEEYHGSMDLLKASSLVDNLKAEENITEEIKTSESLRADINATGGE